MALLSSRSITIPKKILTQHPLVDKYDLSSIDRWACGAAPLGSDLIDLVEKRTKILVRGGYGMTETTCVISIAAFDNSKRGTVGTLVPNMSGKLVEGELFIKGPNIMKGYLRNPNADADTFTEDGWMKTGDVCMFDEDGSMFIVDRVKEVSLRYMMALCTPEINKNVYIAHKVQGFPSD
jgi:long-subunit acyl-CoA synthetase (AMP-forming)